MIISYEFCFSVVLFCLFACLSLCQAIFEGIPDIMNFILVAGYFFFLINSLKLVYTMQLMLCRTIRFSWVLLLWFISGSGTVLSLGLFIPHFWDKTFLSTLSMRWACQSNWYEQVLFPALCEYRDRSF